MSVTKIETPTTGLVGYIHEIELQKDTVIIFQLPRETKMLSNSYIEGAMRVVRESLPEGKTAMVIGCDVNIYELTGSDISILKLKGLL